MLKPLLHTIPSLSGNVTLACDLTDYARIGGIIECHVRNARLVPLSSDLRVKKCEVSLLTSSYEFDIKKFYSYYPDHFYESMFSFNKEEYAEFTSEETMKFRDRDFEFGTKRVPVQSSNGNTFAFFAPFWAESVEDLPDYFLIDISIDSSTYDLHKQVKVMIRDYDASYKYNYLWKYLEKYFNHVDSNVVFCRPRDNKATYYGISLLRGGFAKFEDSIIAKNWSMQSSIDKFDENIAAGFKRTRMCVKQIMPLSFYFCVEDFLNEEEMKRFKGSTLCISGTWWKDGKKLPFYDFSTDYNFFTQKVWNFRSNGIFDYIESTKNVMDVGYPSLNEARLASYKYFNTGTKDTVRWKLKYSKDDDPYITNMSFAFSFLQASPSKYREFPSRYVWANAFCDKSNDIVLPRNEALHSESSLYSKDERNLMKYRNALLMNASNWFTVLKETEWYEKMTVSSELQFLDKAGKWYIETDEIRRMTSGDLSAVDIDLIYSTAIDGTKPATYRKLHEDEHADILASINNSTPVDLYIKHSIFEEPSYWAEVIDGKTYANGILYDLKKIWEEHPGLPRIDKFGVFLKPFMNPVDKNRLEKIKSAKWTLLSCHKDMHLPNAFVHTDIKSMLTGTPVEDTRSLYMNELGIQKQVNEITHDSLYFKNEETTDGDFINLLELGYDIHELNIYYKLSDIEAKFSMFANKIRNSGDRYLIDGYELLPVYRLKQIMNSTEFMFSKYKTANARWIFENLYFSTRDNYAKVKYDKNTFKKFAKSGGSNVLDYLLYIRDSFISKKDFRDIVGAESFDSNVPGNLREYKFNPILVDDNDTIGTNVFTFLSPLTGKNYGDILPVSKINVDYDFIYVDIFNLKNAIGISDALINETKVELYGKFLNDVHMKVYLSGIGRDEDNHDVSDLASTLYIKKRVLVNDMNAHNIVLRDKLIPVKGGMYPDDMEDSQVIRHLLDDLKYYPEDNAWGFTKTYLDRYDASAVMEDTHSRVKEPEDYRVELVYERHFIKVSNVVWDKIKIDNSKEYKDLYLFRMSRDDEYNKNLIYYYDESESPLEETQPTSKTLEPLFDDVWMQRREATVIYSEWEQNKITKTSIVPDGQNITTVSALYRYDCDDVPYMFDIRTFDLRHAYIVSKGWNGSYSYWMSYAYEEAAREIEDPEVGTVTYAIQNNQLSLDDRFKRLQTYRKLAGGSSRISLAYGCEPVAYYYSAYSYNDIGSNEITTVAYYSDESHSRIDFDYLLDTHASADNAQVQQYFSDEDGANVSYWAYTFVTTYDFVYTYHWIKGTYKQNPIYFDSLGIYDRFGISTYTMEYEEVVPVSYLVKKSTMVPNSDGITMTEVITYETGVRYDTLTKTTTYGMLEIDAEFDNTNSSFNIVDIHGNDKKFFTSIDKRSIYEDGFRLHDVFKELMPFSKLWVGEIMDRYELMVKPTVFNFTNHWIAVDSYDGTYEAKYSVRPLGSSSLERYFDSITPYIFQTNVTTTYSAKYKDTRKTLMKKPSDTSMYKSELSIWRYSPPRIYSTLDEFNDFIETERKHFNDSFMINLEKEIVIDKGGGLTYEEICVMEAKENVIADFANYMRQFGKFDDSSILFLYNKYIVKYDSVCTGLDYERKNKLYSLKLKFILK